MVISFITTTFRYVSMIILTFKVLFVKLCSLMLSLGLSVPEDVPRCSASLLALLASFINYGKYDSDIVQYTPVSMTQILFSIGVPDVTICVQVNQ